MIVLLSSLVVLTLTTAQGGLERKPSIQDGEGSKVNVTEGMTAVLKCRVNDLGQNTVRWKFKSVIFKGYRKRSRDRRLMLITQSETQWDLCIRNVRKEDEGKHRCLVNTRPREVKYTQLIVADSTCRKDEFPCQGKGCLPKHKQCDDHQDCPDGSDEMCCDRCEGVKCALGGKNIASNDTTKCCQCRRGFTGSRCEYCDLRRINCNNGKLSASPNSNGKCTCTCKDGYVGKFCQYPDDGNNTRGFPKQSNCSQTKLDVLFVLDRSAISEEPIFEFIKQFIERKSVATGLINAGLITFDLQININFTTRIKRDLSGKRSYPPLRSNRQKNLEGILEIVRKRFQIKGKNARATDLTVLIMDDKRDITSATAEAKALMNDDVYIIVITPKNTSGILEIASHPQAIVATGPFSDFCPYSTARDTVLILCSVCDKGWRQMGNSCYRLFTKADLAAEITTEETEAITWTTADLTCRNHSSRLLSINSEEEERTVLNHVLHDFIRSNKSFIHIGLKRGLETAMYSTMFRWVDGKPPVYDNWVHGGKCWNRSQPDGSGLERCGAWDLRPNCSGWVDVGCAHPLAEGFICEAWSRSRDYTTEKNMPQMIPPSTVSNSSSFDPKSVFTCVSGEIVSLSARCDNKSNCSDGDDEVNCTDYGSDDMFKCGDGKSIPLGLYCNFVPDCYDGSDEDCDHPECLENQWKCRNKQCIDEEALCDFRIDCIDKSDEEECEQILPSRGTSKGFRCFDGSIIPREWRCDDIVDCPGLRAEDEDSCNCLHSNTTSLPGGLQSGMQDALNAKNDCRNSYDEIWAGFSLKKQCTWNFVQGNMDRMHLKTRRFKGMAQLDCSNVSCFSEMEFKCPGSYCIPSLFVCNGVEDCPDGVDEAHCDQFTCGKSFRCANDHSCIPTEKLFDGTPDCPQHDDENYYQAVCSATNCKCRDAIITCTKSDSPDNRTFHDQTRKISISDTSIADTLFEDLHYLASLVLTNCSLKVVPSLKGVWNLLKLNLDHNEISTLSEGIFDQVRRLQFLSLVGNRGLRYLSAGCCDKLNSLEVLLLDETAITTINHSTFRGLQSLKRLSITFSQLQSLDKGIFSGLNVRRVNLSGNPNLQFEEGVFENASHLKRLETDNIFLCCDEVRPKSLMKELCKAPVHGVSSCRDLMQRDPLKFFIWLIGFSAVVGNLIAICYRLLYDKTSLTRGYGIFVSNLCLSDFIMGVYMIIIAAADAAFRDKYMWKEYSWRHSPVCQLAGFLSTLSCEASTLFICLITLDRFLVIKYDFGRMKFNPMSAIIVSFFVWFVCIVLASIPLLPPWHFQWKLYSRNGVCLALPLMNLDDVSQNYSIGVFIGLNFAAFVLIAAGQAAIYKAMRNFTPAERKVRNSQDMAVARKLSLIVITDFICWFPICVMGLLAATGTTIPRETYAWTAVFVLPINSALNPFLYTLISAMQRRIQELKDGTFPSNKAETSITHGPKITIGFPTAEMVSLRIYLGMRNVSVKEQITCLGHVMLSLPILQAGQKNHQTLSADNIFIGWKGKCVEQICFAVEEDCERGFEEDATAITDIIKIWTAKLGRQLHD